MKQWVKDYGATLILGCTALGALLIWTVNVTVTAETAELSTKVNSAEQSLSVISEDISALKTEVGSIKTDVGYIRERLGRVETDIDWIRTHLQNQ